MYVSSVCSKCFICSTNVASVLSGCCKSRYECCIYMHFASICFKCFQGFIRMFASVSSECCICLQWFLNVFETFSQVFQMLLLSVSFVFFCMFVTVASKCFKSRSVVAHVMHMEIVLWHVQCSGQRGRRPEQRGPTTGVLPCDPNVRLLPLRSSVWTLEQVRFLIGVI